MEPDPAPLRLAELPHDIVRERLAREPRLLLPVGAIGDEPGLPVGWRGLLVGRLADEGAAALGWLRAPTLAYGARDHAGAAPLSVRRRTLHRFVNDVLAHAETWGTREVIILTARASEPQLEALATVHVKAMQLRVVDVLPPGALGATAAEDATVLARLVTALARPEGTAPGVDALPAFTSLKRRVLAVLAAHARGGSP